MKNLFDDLASTDEEIKAATRKKGRAKKQFTCIECGGSGLWQSGRANVHGNKNCWTCSGKGYVLTDPIKLVENRIKRAQKKTEALADFRAEHIEVIAELTKAAGWSSFAASLIDQLSSKPWSEKQLAAARSMAAKLAANRERKEQERKEQAVQVDLQPIRDMFETAVANGYQRPKYRAEGLEISRAPNHGRNPGALYIKDAASDYQGKILGTAFQPIRNVLADVADRLQLIAKDPMAAAVAFGRRTGRCACCGRKLTDPKSIEAGIGPICADKWGF